MLSRLARANSSMNTWKQAESSAGISRKNDSPVAGSAAPNSQKYS
jgi:hypothetical protein